MGMEKHKMREHETTSEEGNKEGENSSEDKETEVEIEQIEEVVGIMVHDLSNRSADYSSYDDKLRSESAVTNSYDDKSRIETVKELEEINDIVKQNINKT